MERTEYGRKISLDHMQTYRMWSDHRDRLIRDAYKYGWSKRAIAREMGISRQTVLNVLVKS